MGSVILCGMKGAGKTTHGQAMAAALGWPFIETDRLIADDCRALWEEIGEEAFRACEREVVNNLRIDRPSIIATGGGTPNIEVLKRYGIVVHLNTPPEVCWKRLVAHNLPSFMQDEHQFLDIYQRRTEYYRQIADVTLELTRV